MCDEVFNCALVCPTSSMTVSHRVLVVAEMICQIESFYTCMCITLYLRTTSLNDPTCQTMKQYQITPSIVQSHSLPPPLLPSLFQIIVRPATVFGAEDRFLNWIGEATCRIPFFPLINDGSALVQPLYAADLGKALMNIIYVSTARSELV